MHSHDRTLLAQLGFSDPDKKDRRHDLACSYLSLPENKEKIRGLILRDASSRLSEETLLTGSFPSDFEKIISKGEGQYKTTIGFIDLVVWFETWRRCPGPRCCDHPPESGLHCFGIPLAVEVKITPVPVGNILRQINLYRAYSQPQLGWLVATAFPVSTSDAAILKSAQIRHARLGIGFEEWLKTQEEADDAADSLTL